MKQWVSDVIASPTKKAFPVLSFPVIQMMGITVKELIMDSRLQAIGMKMNAEHCDSAAIVSQMDLSIEAEAFGASIVFSDDEVPTVTGRVVSSQVEADALQVPEIGAGRTGLNIDAVGKAVELVTDRPVFAGCIGPFSLAGRLMDVNEIMVYCYTEPEMVHTVLEKATEFLIEYANAYKEAGASGIVIAEPLAGILSPDLATKVSARYVRRIVNAVTDDDFVVIYHNCGNEAIKMLPTILMSNAAGYHFGNGVDMRKVCRKMPEDVLVMGNVDPAGVLLQGTPEKVRTATMKVMEECTPYPNFVISSGCDIPPMTPWENIDAFFDAAVEFYANKENEEK
jgi:uroporphyrinogen decarboxylase